MTRYILQRLALLPLLMVIYSFVIFVIIQAPPGDFLTSYMATLASPGLYGRVARPGESFFGPGS